MNFTTTARTALTLVAVTAACLSTALPTQAGTAQDKKTITLGDLDPKVDAKSVGAPFDPCQVGWESMPAEVRSATNAKPKLRAPKKDDVFAVGCRYDNGAADEVSTEQGAAPKVGKNFFVLVVWAKPGQMATAQADHAGSQSAQFGPKSGLLKPTTNNASQEAACTAIMPLANGSAAVGITNGRFPQVDTCSIAKTIATSIAEKTP
ncbi:hypothetical protein [Lentzea flaviverrucosa]|uniref:DUF3558 domain-containing protein n=1 Tax=Lentzea flaviverrucosa TaxID=200379 RepID=A0A1H9ET47_9PSEU|nr:hypothetical protein [Lentzea flaviverrucosa]RDI35403.1 hypothetical protein DFR72_1011154 [Lentzea flaviverrucosa]SEQ28819.1 Protein of unknown function [Lentzea flaviverrucosa]